MRQNGCRGIICKSHSVTKLKLTSISKVHHKILKVMWHCLLTIIIRTSYSQYILCFNNSPYKRYLASSADDTAVHGPAAFLHRSPTAGTQHRVYLPTTTEPGNRWSPDLTASQPLPGKPVYRLCVIKHKTSHITSIISHHVKVDILSFTSIRRYCVLVLFFAPEFCT